MEPTRKFEENSPNQELRNVRFHGNVDGRVSESDVWSCGRSGS